MSTQPVLVNADEVRDHWWWRPGWRVGQRAYTWHLTFDGQHDLHRLAHEYQSALAHLPQVDPVPPEWLHLTMQGVGFAADVPADELAAVVAAVRSRLARLAPAALTFTRPVVLPEAIALPPEPAEPVHAIRGAIRIGIADAWGVGNVPEAEDGYRAHVSIGYVNESGLASPIVAALDIVEPEPASVIVREASLIELHRDHRVYEWRVVQDLPLGALA